MRPRPLPPLQALVAEILGHWRHERGTLRQGFTALGVLLAVTILAGVMLGEMESLLERYRGLLVLVPAAIGMRGAIFGALGARLGTGMLTGQFERGLHRSSFMVQNLEAAALLSVVTGALLGVAARISTAAFGLPSIGLGALVTVSMLGALLASVFLVGVVLALTRTADRRSWDMDAIGTPIISASADIATLPALVLATLTLGQRWVEGALGSVFVIAAVAAAVYGLRHPSTVVRRIFSESLPVLCYAAVMGILAGTVLSARLEALVTSPALLVAIPPFIASCGALGGMLSARLASALHLGLLNPRGVPERGAALDATLLVLFALVGFTGVGVLARLASVFTGAPSPPVVDLVAITLLGGLLATALVFAVSYYTAITSYRFGLDPDNYGVPVVTATMDFLGILCLVGAIALVGIT